MTDGGWGQPGDRYWPAVGSATAHRNAIQNPPMFSFSRKSHASRTHRWPPPPDADSRPRPWPPAEPPPWRRMAMPPSPAAQFFLAEQAPERRCCPRALVVTLPGCGAQSPVARPTQPPSYRAPSIPDPRPRRRSPRHLGSRARDSARACHPPAARRLPCRVGMPHARQRAQRLARSPQGGLRKTGSSIARSSPAPD